MHFLGYIDVGRKCLIRLETVEQIETPKEETKDVSKIKKVVEKSAEKTTERVVKEEEVVAEETKEDTAKKVIAKAAYGHKLLTGVTLTNNEGEDADDGTINYWEKSQGYYTFKLPDGQVKAGDTMTIQLPKELVFATPVGFPVLDSNKQRVVDATINSDKQTVTV